MLIWIRILFHCEVVELGGGWGNSRKVSEMISGALLVLLSQSACLFHSRRTMKTVTYEGNLVSWCVGGGLAGTCHGWLGSKSGWKVSLGSLFFLVWGKKIIFFVFCIIPSAHSKDLLAKWRCHLEGQSSPCGAPTRRHFFFLIRQPLYFWLRGNCKFVWILHKNIGAFYFLFSEAWFTY